MKIILVGATGTIGSQVYAELIKKHEVVTAGSKTGMIQVDIQNPESIQKMYDSVGAFDALVSAAGQVHFGEFDQMRSIDFELGLQNKLMGQVNLVRLGLKTIRPGGSFTLVSGILADDPIVQGVSASMVNGALHSFVKAAAIELHGGIRINVVSPGLVEESVDKYASLFRGHVAVPMQKVVSAFIKSIEGAQTGQVLRVY